MNTPTSSEPTVFPLEGIPQDTVDTFVRQRDSIQVELEDDDGTSYVMESDCRLEGISMVFRDRTIIKGPSSKAATKTVATTRSRALQCLADIAQETAKESTDLRQWAQALSARIEEIFDIKTAFQSKELCPQDGDSPDVHTIERAGKGHINDIPFSALEQNLPAA